MKVAVELGKLRQERWQEMAIRFVFGGIVTVITGVIGHRFGPVVGGLFLAFPAILPASATLVQKHKRSKLAAGVDIFGATIGGIGLLAFGAVIWGLGRVLAGWLDLLIATVAWFTLSALYWLAFRWVRHRQTPLEAHRKARCPDNPPTDTRAA